MICIYEKLFVLSCFIYHKNVNGDYLWMMRFQVRFAFSLYLHSFFSWWSNNVIRTDLSFSIFEFCILLVYSVSFQVITNIARKNRIYYYLREPNCKNILFVIVPTKSSYSDWSSFASQSIRLNHCCQGQCWLTSLGLHTQIPWTDSGKKAVLLKEAPCALIRIWKWNYRVITRIYPF